MNRDDYREDIRRSLFNEEGEPEDWHDIPDETEPEPVPRNPLFDMIVQSVIDIMQEEDEPTPPYPGYPGPNTQEGYW